MRSKRKHFNFGTGCPRCGTPYTKRCGFRVCSNAQCGHRENSQFVAEGYPYIANAGGGYMRLPPRDNYEGGTIYAPHPRGTRRSMLYFKD
jgi:hypothetical protein